MMPKWKCLRLAAPNKNLVPGSLEPMPEPVLPCYVFMPLDGPGTFFRERVRNDDADPVGPSVQPRNLLLFAPFTGHRPAEPPTDLACQPFPRSGRIHPCRSRVMSKIVSQGNRPSQCQAHFNSVSKLYGMLTFWRQKLCKTPITDIGVPARQTAWRSQAPAPAPNSLTACQALTGRGQAWNIILREV